MIGAETPWHASARRGPQPARFHAVSASGRLAPLLHSPPRWEDSMKRTSSLAVVVAIAAVAVGAGSAVAGDVNINIGAPAVVAAPPIVAAVVVAPPPIIVERPRVILVPETRVYTAPSVAFNVFLFDGRYYSHHHDHWFVAVRHGAPWTHVAYEQVPVEVRRIPAKYY